VLRIERKKDDTHRIIKNKKNEQNM